MVRVICSLRMEIRLLGFLPEEQERGEGRETFSFGFSKNNKKKTETREREREKREKREKERKERTSERDLVESKRPSRIKETREMSSRNKDKDKDITTALVIADSFDFRFTPISLELPRALLPLINVPLLDYTLHFLLSAGMKKVIIFCCANAEKIEKYIS